MEQGIGNKEQGRNMDIGNMDIGYKEGTWI